MALAGKQLAAGLAALCAIAGTGVALAAPPQQPIVSAPSQYVEVIPTAGGGVPDGSAGQRSSPARPSGPNSALGAAADAVGSADRLDMLALAATMVAATACLTTAAIRRSRAA